MFITLAKEAFLSNNADTGEEPLVFDTSPSYEDVVAKVRQVLKWMDTNVDVKLIGRYDVGVGAKSRLKSMPITSDLHWDVYKEKVSQSEDKSLELFATKVESPRFTFDLNRHVSSPMDDMSERTMVPLVEHRVVVDAPMLISNHVRVYHLVKQMRLSCMPPMLLANHQLAKQMKLR